MLKIFCDTDSEMTLEKAKEYGFTVISMPYTIDGVNYFPNKETDEFDYKGYYDLLRSGVVPTTSALNQEEYVKYFEPVFANGDDILYVHFSSAMSASFGFMDMAVKELLAKYPGRQFHKIDTLSITIGSYIIVDKIGQMVKSGATLEQLLEFGEKEIQHYACYFFADDLKFFRRSGRVSGLASFFGGLIGIRPIIVIDGNGVMRSIDKVKGRISAIEYLVNKVKELGDHPEQHKIVIGHTDASPELLNQLETRLREEFGKDVLIERIMVNPTIGAHCGPNGVGVAFRSKER